MLNTLHNEFRGHQLIAKVPAGGQTVSIVAYQSDDREFELLCRRSTFSLGGPLLVVALFLNLVYTVVSIIREVKRLG